MKWDDVLARHERLLRRGAPRGGLAGRAVTPSPVRRSTEQLSQQRRTAAAGGIQGDRLWLSVNTAFTVNDATTDPVVFDQVFQQDGDSIEWNGFEDIELTEGGIYLVCASIAFADTSTGVAFVEIRDTDSSWSVAQSAHPDVGGFAVSLTSCGFLYGGMVLRVRVSATGGDVDSVTSGSGNGFPPNFQIVRLT